MRTQALELIARNIESYGHHVYLVTGEASPRYAYSIGLTGTLGRELILAGAIHYSAEEAKRIINELADRLREGAASDSAFIVEGLGSFTLRSVRGHWVELLMLGALDYYGSREVAAYQVLPDKDHWTVDIPNFEEEWDAPANGPWRWLREEWLYPVPRNSLATTNLAALRGGRITEAARWEENEWELFAGAGPDVNPEDARVVPLGVLLGADESLSAVVDLGVGEALWRDKSGGPWSRWVARES